VGVVDRLDDAEVALDQEPKIFFSATKHTADHLGI